MSENTSKKPSHNLQGGPSNTCQICGSSDLELVIDLGHQPLCDSLLREDQLNQPETFYPLRQLWCKECSLNQLDYIVPGEVVYHQDYPYRTGVTKELVAYQKILAEEVVSDLGIKRGRLAVDIGSNDGTLLSGFKSQGMEVLGVEPTNIAAIANELEIETIHSPFNNDVAKEIVNKKGTAGVVTATNVFAHMATLGDVMQGLETLVADDGYFVLENHYLKAITEKSQFDTIYHEHLRTYTLLSLVKLFDYYDFTIVDAMEVTRYGGNIRVYAAKGKGHTPKASVQEMLDMERNLGFLTSDYYKNFSDNAIRVKNDLVRMILDLKAKGHSVVANSCPGRSATLLNFAGIGPDLLPYIAEQPTSLKLNKYSPGTHIRIVNNQRLIDEQPDYVVLLAWHLAEPIAQQLRDRGLTSKLIVPMPEVEILNI